MGSAQGYQSLVKVLVSVKADAPDTPLGKDPVIHRMAIVSSQETPGLGENAKAVQQDVSFWAALSGARSKATRPWFQEQFSDKSLSDLVVVKKKGDRQHRGPHGRHHHQQGGDQKPPARLSKIIKRTAEVYGK